MLQDKNIDNLFSQGLEQEKPFHNSQEQWNKVSARLAISKTRRLVWFVMSSLLILAFISFVIYSQIMQTNHVGNQLEVATSAERKVKDHASVLSTIKGSLNKHENINSNSANLPLTRNGANQVSNSKTNQSIFGKKVSSLSVSTIANNKKCDCPADESKSEISNSEVIYSDILEGDTRESHKTELPYSTSIGYTVNELTQDERDQIDILLPLKNANSTEPLIFHRHLKPVENWVTPIPSNLFAVKFRAGIFTEYIKTDSLRNESNLGWSGDLALHYRKWSLSLGYRNHTTERTIASDILSYNIPDTNFVYGYQEADSVTISTSNHLYNLVLGYQLYRHRGIDFQFYAGLQARKISEGNLNFSYGEFTRTEASIPAQRLVISDMLFGSSLNVSIYRGLGLDISYSMLLPLDIEQVQWPKRHQLGLGLTYTLK